MKLAIGGDHAGFELKQKLMAAIENRYSIKDFGCFTDNSVDYPDFVHPLAMSVANGQYELGILICGSGNGVCMTANKHQQIRAALCWDVEIASLARQHNDANVLCLGSRFISPEDGLKIVQTFLKTPFAQGRHLRRVVKLTKMT